jgi:hypothetical protein
MRVLYVGVTCERVESVIGEHLASHPPEDWVLTIAGLRGRVRELEATVARYERPSLLGGAMASLAFCVAPPDPPAVHLIPIPIFGPMIQRWRR